MSTGEVLNIKIAMNGLPQETLIQANANIDKDIRHDARNFIRQNLLWSSVLNDEQQSDLEEWLTDCIRRERQGWKLQLESAMKEVEKQRKDVLISKAQVQESNDQISNLLDLLGAEVAEPIYDDDGQEVTDTFQLLKQNMQMMHDVIQQIGAEREQTFILLQKENIENGLALQDLVKLSIDGLKREISKLKLHIDEQKKEQKTTNTPEKPKQIHQKENKVKNNKETFKEEPKFEREKNIPIIEKELVFGDDDTERLNEKKSRDSNRSNRSLERAKAKKALAVMTADDVPVKLTAEIQPIRTVERLHEQQKVIDRLKSQVKDLENLLHEKSREINKHRSYIKTLKYLYHYGGFQQGHYQGQGQNKNERPKASLDYLDYVTVDKVGRAMNGKVSQSLPFLGESPDSLQKELAIVRSPARKEEASFPSVKTSVTRCFRCQKLYRLQDNHKKACRYHPKGKRKIEKYNTHGKLLKVSFVWECCQQDIDCDGCATEEHI